MRHLVPALLFALTFLSACPNAADGFFAIKNTLDVWWPARSGLDPGRGEVEVTALAKMSSVCGEATMPATTLKVCDVKLPVFTSDVFCEAYQVSFPHDVWDATTMPRLVTTTSLTGFSADDVLRVERVTGLFDSVTATLRDDDAVYTGPDYSPVCTQGLQTQQGLPYRFHAVPAQQDAWGAGGADGSSRLRVTQLGLEIRLSVGLVGTLAAACEVAATSLADMFEVSCASCAIEPSSLPQGIPGLLPPDPRIASMNYACTGEELSFVDSLVPGFQVLQRDQVPGEANVAAGWALFNRDIPRHPSLGPQVSLARLGEISAVEPTCAEVRAVVE